MTLAAGTVEYTLDTAALNPGRIRSCIGPQWPDSSGENPIRKKRAGEVSESSR